MGVVGMKSRLIFHELYSSQKGYSTQKHSHDCIQAEFILAGRVIAEVDGERVVLERYDAILIPDGAEHVFYYGDIKSSWISLKLRCDFSFSGYRVIKSGRDNRNLTRTIFQLGVSANENGSPYLRALDLVCQGALQLFLDDTKTERPGDDTRFIKLVMAQIRKYKGRPLSIATLAKNMGYSVGRLSSRFSQEYGTPLKEVIDRERADMAERMLLYSDLGINRIAAELGFEDVYSFSRFFKRLYGLSPRHYKKQAINVAE